MSGAVPLFPYYAFMLGAGTGLNFRTFTFPATLNAPSNRLKVGNFGSSEKKTVLNFDKILK
jgi:hypothetical protein